MIPIQVELAPPTREDVERVDRWLQDDEVNALWLGRSPTGEPAHLGYFPSRTLTASAREWKRVFQDPQRQILAVHSRAHGHIGEAQMALQEVFRRAELAVFIGRKDLFGQGFETRALRELLRRAFEDRSLARAWVEVPEYNPNLLSACRELGFAEEGRLRKALPRGHDRSDSLVLGMVVEDYRRLLEREVRSADPWGFRDALL